MPVFHASGGVWLPAASIGGDLTCSGGWFANPEGKAFFCEAAQVRGALRWRGVAMVKGTLDLTALRAANLVDDAASWEKADKDLILDGFQYERLTGGASNDAAMRIAWLTRQVPEPVGKNFQLQP